MRPGQRPEPLGGKLARACVLLGLALAINPGGAQESPDSGDGCEARVNGPNQQGSEDENETNEPEKNPEDEALDESDADNLTGNDAWADQGDGGGAGGTPGGLDGDGYDESWGDAMGSGGDTLNMVMDPIDTRMASVRHVQVDYLARGNAPLRLARVWLSNAAAFPAQTTINLGAGWRSHWDKTVQSISASQARLHRANGRVVDFTLSGSTWSSSLATGVLTRTASGWQYLNDRNQTETYNSAGRLVSLAQAGLTTTLQYDASNRLVGITQPFGRALAFTYDGANRMSTATLPGGGTLTYTYGANNNLTSVRFADGTVRQYAYENASYPSALTGVIDESGRRRITWGYDAAGRPSGGYYGSGAVPLSVSYGSGTVTTTDARGAQRTRTFATVNGKPQMTGLQTAATADSPATAWAFAYDALGRPTGLTTRSGEQRSFSTDVRGRTIQSSRGVGTIDVLTKQTTWHPTYRLATQRIARGVTTNYTIDAAGRTTGVSRIGADGSTATVFTRVYNAQGLLQSHTNARGATTTYGYDSAGNRVSATNALGQVTTYGSFNAHGQPGTIQRPDGTVVSLAYNTRGRLVTRTEAGLTTSYTYDAAGRLLRKTLPDGSWAQHGYDTAGFLSSTTNHRGESVAYVREPGGRISTRTTYSAQGASVLAEKKEFTGHGRLAAMVDSRNQRTTFTYAADGRPAGTTNALGETRSVQLDVLSRPARWMQPNTAAMRAAGGPATVAVQNSYAATRATKSSTTDVRGVATNLGYDGFNRQLSEAGTDAGTTRWARNAAGDITSYTDPRGIITNIGRDALGRITNITPTGQTGTTITYVTGREGPLPASVVEMGVSTSWTYDSAGRVMSKAQTVGGVARNLSYLRDTLGRVTRITYPSGMRVDYAYSGDVVSSISVNGAALLGSTSYQPMSSVATGWTWGNGRTHSRSFDRDGRMTQVVLGSTTRSYTFDPVGRVSSYADTGPSGTATTTVSYDEAGQIRAFSGPQGNVSYGWDANGNRITTTQGSITTTNAYYAGTNRLQGSPNGSYTYDVDGNPLSDGFYSFGYDPQGRMTGMSNSEYRVKRTYNAFGQRVYSQALLANLGLNAVPPAVEQGAGPSTAGAATAAATAASPKLAPTHAAALRARGGLGVGGSALAAGAQPSAAAAGAGTLAPTWIVVATRHFVHDDLGRLVGEYPVNSPSLVTQETVWFNGLPVAAMIGGVLYHVHADHLATPRSLTRASDGVEMWRWNSDPFGSTFPTFPSGTIITYNMRFPGQQFDDDTGLHYNWMRDYSAVTGRYLQADPLGLEGGLARYAYAAGNPLTYSDPTGLIIFLPLLGWSAAAVTGDAIVIGGVWWWTTQRNPPAPTAPSGESPSEKYNRCLNFCSKILERPKVCPGSDYNQYDFYACMRDCMSN